MKRIVLIKIENWRVHGDFYCAFNKLDFSVVVFLYKALSTYYTQLIVGRKPGC